MARFSSHADWLPLIEISGPFLTTAVLDRIFPQGLDAVYPETKKHLRLAYESWCANREKQDSKMPALHRVWCNIVLTELLDFTKEDFQEGSAWTANDDTGTQTVFPTYAIADADGTPQMFVLILPPDTKLTAMDKQNEWSASPIEKMTRLCRKHGVRLGLLTNGEAWTLVNAPLDGISGTATWYARLWFQEPKTLRAFSSLLGMRRLFGPQEERLPELLRESAEHQEEVTGTLGNQVRAAVEVFIQGLDKAISRGNQKILQGVSSTDLYEAGLTVMMRLVFLLCAEERGLLLDDDRFAQYYSISTLRGQLESAMHLDTEERLERNFDAWPRLLALFRAVYGGIEHPALRLPALGGTIFNPDKYPFLEGRMPNTSWRDTNPEPLAIDNRTILLLLNSLQILEQPGGALHLSYRSLDVESIGHIYEGLLEYTAKKTEEVTLGLQGTKGRLPNMTLSELETLALFDQPKLFAKVNEITGRGLPAIKNAYARPATLETMQALTIFCGNDKELLGRIVPFANWLREDAWGKPLVYAAGSYMVTPGQDRRDTGTHYTPKALTVKIVERTLEPLVYEGPADGLPRKEWRLKSPKELLTLKVGDNAMGSGAFLVQSCRYLGERLCEAWGQAEAEGKFVTSSGEVHDTADAEPMSTIAEERLNEARRLVAEKCLYGVDINPLAVELAKLSLWLVTTSKGRPFAFLDHNLKSGDSLLGVANLEQLRTFSLVPQDDSFNFLYGGKEFSERIKEIMELRKEISATVIRDITDMRRMEEQNMQANQKLERLKLLADLFVGQLITFTGEMSKSKDRQKIENLLQTISPYANIILTETEEKLIPWRKDARERLSVDLSSDKPPRTPFHWVLEFPEVFSEGGFDALVGNPPFTGGKRLKGAVGEQYRSYLLNFIANGEKGSADLCAYFYLRAFSLLKGGGIFGLIACNTIAEGDTRQVGLERMVRQGGSIIAANPNMPWPGTASVVISLVFFWKDKAIGHVHQLANVNGIKVCSSQQDGHWHGLVYFNDQLADTISPFLALTEGVDLSPKALVQNANKCFGGSYVLGLGFTMSEEEAQAFIAKDSKNAEVLFPYINGDDLNSSPKQKASRWVINFFDWPLDRDADGSWEYANDRQRKTFLSIGHVPTDYTGHVASDFPEILNIIEEKVKPERQRRKEDGSYVLRKPLPERWWHYGDKRPALYHAIGRGEVFAQHPKGWNNPPAFPEVIAVSLVQSYLKFEYVQNNMVFAHKLAIILPRPALLAILSTNIYQEWVRKTSSTMGFGINFSPSDSFETFPFPMQTENIQELEGQYEEQRRVIMQSDNIGLTQLYNLVNNPENHDTRYEEFRRLQREIDTALRNAYGWTDIDLEHGFHSRDYLPENDNIRYTISEAARVEILKRLAKLNYDRWEQEQKNGG